MIEADWIPTIDYQEAWDWQEALVKVRNADLTLPDKLLLLEHPHTYTFGTGGRQENLVADTAELAAQGIPVYQVNRGGDITYHGPGQLVGYPILNLKRLAQQRGAKGVDLHGYLRDLEQVIIETLAKYDIEGWRYRGYTGVWVGEKQRPTKIAAIGIRVSSRGISSHGFALNVMPDMSKYANIIPCGISEHGVTSMAIQLQRQLAVTDILNSVVDAFAEVFGVELRLREKIHF